MEPAPASQRTSGLAIASLIISIIGFGLLSPLAIIFGHVSRGKIRRDPNLSGSGLALAGLIVGYTGVFLVVAAVIIGIAGAMTMPALAQTKQRAVLNKSMSNARQVWLAVQAYESQEGKVPDSLDELIPDYLSKPLLYTDPVSGRETPFEYFKDRASIPFIIAAPLAYRDQRIVVRQDGGIDELSETEFLDRAGRAP